MVIGMAAGGAATPLPVTGVQVAYVDEAGAERRGALDVVWQVRFERVSPVRSFGSVQGSGVSRGPGGSPRRAGTSVSSPGRNATW